MPTRPHRSRHLGPEDRAALALTGRILLGLALAAFGARYLLLAKLAAGLPPLPEWLPAGRALAYVAGTLLLAAAVLLVAGIRVALVSRLLGWLLLASSLLFLTHIQAVLRNGNVRTGLLEPLALAGVAWVLSGSRALPAPTSSPRLPLPAIGRALFALTLIAFGLQHFEYVGFLSFLIPAWLPVARFWVLFTGCAFLAAGVALALRRFDRLAALLLAAMFFGWILVLHGPRIAHAPLNGNEWTSGFVALAFAAAGLILASAARPAGTAPRQL